ncbi:2,3-diaminopropionate biosynthesis protein SbnB [Streptomyces dangxiongensis]|uniref:2,3-diaminopropionate biosynthesis protein SbnB n=1 Tax=Streptomyces dangxiongensis TaxID=1442032 RepID=A0A3G2JDE2_9ACTN|nr:2,3-diaminopropionate biosynthesis protein SbnB [Streptomyces dangxiongensis]AYN39631.1 2,3-diaminopropionate biosynthesis protein SbnB [Streptomyces dangxiongensis]
MSGATVHDVLDGRENEVVDLVARAYTAHGRQQTVNPPSYFLRFPDRPDSRIIALPASLGGEFGVDGIKWISSFPANITSGLPRASAVLILNDHETGYPFACLESSIISATRTAASAALAADRLHAGRPRPRRITFFGTGLIACSTHRYLTGTGWDFDTVTIHDHSAEYARGFADYVSGTGHEGTVTVSDDAETAVRGSDLIVFATTAGEPHVHEPDWFSHNPTVLHISLRDLSPAIILGSTNVVDDVEHSLKANTSPHLAEQATGNRSFINGTLSDVLDGTAELPTDRPLVFSPFGLGVLDLAVGVHVYGEALRRGLATPVPGFFHVLSRYA